MHVRVWGVRAVAAERLATRHQIALAGLGQGLGGDLGRDLIGQSQAIAQLDEFASIGLSRARTSRTARLRAWLLCQIGVAAKGGARA